MKIAVNSHVTYSITYHLRVLCMDGENDQYET